MPYRTDTGLQWRTPMEPIPHPGANQRAAPGRYSLTLVRAISWCGGSSERVNYERPHSPWLSSPVGCPSRDLNQGHHPPRLGDVVRRSMRLRGRRHTVLLATRVKIGPVVLSGSLPLTTPCQPAASLGSSIGPVAIAKRGRRGGLRLRGGCKGERIRQNHGPNFHPCCQGDSVTTSTKPR